ncbi:MAG: hypothetical protein LUG89_02490 [Methanosphaera sp.]|nr:hypothetical protein [Methanosphaera sp.]
MNSQIDNIINVNNTVNNTTSSVYNMAPSDSAKTTKVYEIDEAGDYVQINYKGITVCVRENYPYYNPQNDKIYYSKEEEAEDLYQLAQNMDKPTIEDLDI